MVNIDKAWSQQNADVLVQLLQSGEGLCFILRLLLKGL